MGRLARGVRSWLGRLLAVHDTPESMARGLAIGFFFGVSFLWGLQIGLAILASYALRGNKVIAASLTAVSNPLTSLPLYGVCYWVGQLILGRSAALPNLGNVRSIHDLLSLDPHFFLALFLGTTVVGLLGGVTLYFFANRIFAALRRWHGNLSARRASRRECEAHADRQVT